ncbi:MAG: rhodanese-like domain-containing protein [Planctomycetales bacterium]
MPVIEITPGNLEDLLSKESHPQLIDVRPAVEFRRVHLMHARNIPFDELSADKVSAGKATDAGSQIVVICKAGVRSRQACEKLAQAGFSSAVSVQGGTDACLSAGLAVQHGPQPMSLERQVRFIAGGIVLTASVLAMTVNPYLAGISAFVGAGLVFAAITNTCGMGMLLAKMPWNR